MTRDDLRAALADLQIAAFLHVIREGESNQNDDAYTLINGGSHFTSFADHPFSGQPAPPGKAAGAYQFIPHTWQGLVQRYGFTNFSPQCQDEGAAALVLEHLAGDAIKAGNVADACQILAPTWVSLRTIGTARAERTFVKFGGTLPVTEPASPTQQDVPAAPAPQGAPMGIALALLPLLAQYVPQLMTLIKPNSQSTARDAAVAQTALNAAAQVAGVLQPGEQAGASHVAATVEKMQADQELVKKVQVAVLTHPEIMPLLEVGGGVAAARKADVQAATNPSFKLTRSAVFVMSLFLLPMCYWFVGSLIAGGMTIPDSWPWYAQLPLKLFGGPWNGESRSGGFNLVIGLILGGICGVYYGISVTQQKREASAAASGGNGNGSQ